MMDIDSMKNGLIHAEKPFSMTESLAVAILKQERKDATERLEKMLYLITRMVKTKKIPRYREAVSIIKKCFGSEIIETHVADNSTHFLYWNPITREIDDIDFEDPSTLIPEMKYSIGKMTVFLKKGNQQPFFSDSKIVITSHVISRIIQRKKTTDFKEVMRTLNNTIAYLDAVAVLTVRMEGITELPEEMQKTRFANLLDIYCRFKPDKEFIIGVPGGAILGSTTDEKFVLKTFVDADKLRPEQKVMIGNAMPNEWKNFNGLSEINFQSEFYSPAYL